MWNKDSKISIKVITELQKEQQTIQKFYSSRERGIERVFQFIHGFSRKRLSWSSKKCFLFSWNRIQTSSKAKKFYYVIIFLNINRVTIFRAKCFDIVTLKVLPTTCVYCNSAKKSTKFRYFEIEGKLN